MLMTARMTNPAFAVDGAMDALNGVAKTISRAPIPLNRELLHLRASQINGCSVCVDMHAKGARKAGESEERIFAVGAGRRRRRGEKDGCGQERSFHRLPPCRGHGGAPILPGSPAEGEPVARLQSRGGG